MRTIETIVTIDESRNVTLHLPLEVEPGTHKIVVVIDDAKENSDHSSATPEESVKSFQGWMTKKRPPVPRISLDEFRRENLYE